ncbi:hypothetical protein D3C87_1435640 [compost metagenome]
MLRYNINNAVVSHGFILVGNFQNLVDLNEFTSPQSESNSKTGNLSYQLTFPKKTFGANVNVNYTVADVAFGKNVFYGPTIGVNKGLDKGKLGLSSSLSYQMQRNNNKDAGTIFNANINGSYRIGKRDAANLSLNYLKSNSKDVTLPSFDELRSNLSLVHSF